MMKSLGGGVPDRFPVSCPHCASVAGVPVAVTTVVDQPRAMRLDFKCGECHHRWWMQFDNHFMIAAPDQEARRETGPRPRNR